MGQEDASFENKERKEKIKIKNILFYSSSPLFLFAQPLTHLAHYSSHPLFQFVTPSPSHLLLFTHPYSSMCTPNSSRLLLFVAPFFSQISPLSQQLSVFLPTYLDTTLDINTPLLTRLLPLFLTHRFSHSHFILLQPHTQDSLSSSFIHTSAVHSNA